MEGTSVEGRPIEIAELAHLIAEAEPDLDEQGQRLALGVYRRLALGRPVPVGQVAQSVGLSAQRAEEIIGGWPGVYRDAHAEIVGFWGLTIRQLTPTHRISIEGHDLYAWCAWDALFLPGLIGKVARVQSECPTTGETISIEVGPDGVQDRSRPAAVVSFLLPERALDADVIEASATSSSSSPPRTPAQHGSETTSGRSSCRSVRPSSWGVSSTSSTFSKRSE